jgi:hypothetical protein
VELLVQITAVAGFVGGIIGWAIKQGIINPLATAIKLLQTTISEFKKVVDKMQDNQHEHDKRLGIVEEQMKVANHRISDLEEVMRK